MQLANVFYIHAYGKRILMEVIWLRNPTRAFLLHLLLHRALQRPRGRR